MKVDATKWTEGEYRPQGRPKVIVRVILTYIKGKRLVTGPRRFDRTYKDPDLPYTSAMYQCAIERDESP